MKLAPRTEANRRLRFANRGTYCTNDLQRESATILDGAAIFVRANVRNVLRELIDEITVGPVDFDAVEPRSEYGITCSLRKRRYILLDL